MVRRADPDLRGDRAESPDLRIRNHAILTKIGKVAEFRIFDDAVAEYLATLPDATVAQLDGRLDNCFGDLWPRARRCVHFFDFLFDENMSRCDDPAASSI